LSARLPHADDTNGSNTSEFENKNDDLQSFQRELAQFEYADENEDENDNEEEEDEEEEDEEEVARLERRSRRRKNSVVSLSSSTTAGVDDEISWDDSGMQVSYVSVPVPTNIQGRQSSNTPTTVVGPTGETRLLVVKALNSLSKQLRKQHFTIALGVRKHARVPIINMETRFGYECDIALGGHNGTDTSAYAANQIQRFDSFAAVVLVLKILLSQQGLDKPFTGGLGSFKLYVLVANHVSVVR
jgi:hypothetical protein